ncbi:MAG: glycosyltransferase [Elusimicrobia bacterium]|nr:glycosyltransferase [Elusimicrobiota bacterium]
MTGVSIIIPTINRGAILNETLAAVHAAIEGLDGEVIVVNDSKSSKAEVSHRRMRVLDSPGSGAASARNFGAKVARHGLLLFIDDDILISPRHIRRTLELHSQNPGACFNFNWKYSDELIRRLDETQMGRFIRAAGQTEYRGWVPDLPWQSRGIFEAPLLAAFYFSIERKTFLGLGGFDESFKRQGGEDDEFSLRLRRQGVRLFIDPEESVTHNESDRMELRTKLARLKTGAFNKRQGFEMGRPECRLSFPLHRRAAYALFSALKPLLITVAEGLPNARFFDPLYSRLVHVLIGTVIFEGYFRSELD